MYPLERRFNGCKAKSNIRGERRVVDECDVTIIPAPHHSSSCSHKPRTRKISISLVCASSASSRKFSFVGRCHHILIKRDYPTELSGWHLNPSAVSYPFPIPLKSHPCFPSVFPALHSTMHWSSHLLPMWWRHAGSDYIPYISFGIVLHSSIIYELHLS